jgi:hypothetical protein
VTVIIVLRHIFAVIRFFHAVKRFIATATKVWLLLPPDHTD